MGIVAHTIGMAALLEDGLVLEFLVYVTTVPELITIILSIITFSMSRTTVKVSHVAPGEHMVPGPLHYTFLKGHHHSHFIDFHRTNTLIPSLLVNQFSTS
jgi:hypothetical protein